MDTLASTFKQFLKAAYGKPDFNEEQLNELEKVFYGGAVVALGFSDKEQMQAMKDSIDWSEKLKEEYANEKASEKSE